MPERARPSSRGLWIALAAAAVTFAVCVFGASRLAPAEGYDGAAFVTYAQVLKDTGGLPAKAQTYEYASPPAYLWESVQLQRVADAVGSPGDEWRSGQLLSALLAAGLVLVAYLLARELWPESRLAPAAAALLTAGVPIVIRLGTMFHPESQLAFLAALALLLTVRGRRRGWPLWDGVALGAVLGLASVTRQTAVVVALALGAFVVADGRRRAARFGAAGLAALVLLAGPWWGWQAHVYGNPLQSNLDRFIIAGGQPRSFYVSAPLRSLVVHPYRPDFAGQLWPQFHADLWSDWFGGQHAYWHEKPSAATRVFESSQSVLGLLATPLALGGLLVFGLRGAARVLRRTASPRDAAFAAFLVLAAATWLAFVVQLVRFPQSGGDPIKASYMLFLAPVFAISGLAAACALWRRGPGWRVALVGWAALYAVSFAGFLATSWPR